MPHLATAYAAVNTLITLGSDAALSSVNRDSLHKFLLRMKDSSGAFRMHHAGEIDVRACYTAISVASILNIMDSELVVGLGDYIIRCQTYEGGIAGEPGSEAHGGYTFCGLATMVLIDEVDRLHLPSLIEQKKETILVFASLEWAHVLRHLYSIVLLFSSMYSFVPRSWKEGSKTSQERTGITTIHATASVVSAPSFQRFAVRTSKTLQDLSTKAEQTKQELTEQIREASKNFDVNRCMSIHGSRLYVTKQENDEKQDE
ncbi:hypothetical protein HPP92_021031 [Vanilla planifolia]|uniref:Prenyltransferase alpha-alpha toroid domain-containing protein n=1 Tax=Vanilla planifolia TaxID=51239 RepID=A0A835Q1K4_VANPL|nr:hypothetical protein HPP92_021031 [Vanilla planifolia]